MEEVFYRFWWLIFPIAFFVFGAWDRWLAYKRSKDRLDLLRSYASQGRDPPPELIRALQLEEDEDDNHMSAYGARATSRVRRRIHRRWGSSPYWAWRTAIVTGAVALGFWLASEFAAVPNLEWAFRLVAIIMSCVAAGHLVLAIFSSTFRGR